MSSGAKDLAIAVGGAICAVAAAMLWWGNESDELDRDSKQDDKLVRKVSGTVKQQHTNEKLVKDFDDQGSVERRQETPMQEEQQEYQISVSSKPDSDLASKRASSSPATVFDAVGGHGSKKNKGPPILVSDDGKIFKPFQSANSAKSKSRGELEAEFYKHVNDEKHPIVDYIPKYYGIQHPENGEDCDYLALENLQHGMSYPCVLDLKMGTQTYDESASAEKIARETEKYPPQAEIGFRIVGMKVHYGQTNSSFVSDRAWCMSLEASDMQNALERFFFNGVCVRIELVKHVIEEVRRIRTMLLATPTWRMYGSSLLVLYDGKQGCMPQLKVKMIDFAHVFPINDGGVDDGYLHGLEFLLTTLETMLEDDGNDAAEQKSMLLGGAVGGAVGGHGNVGKGIAGQVIKEEEDSAHFDTEVAFYREAYSSNDSMCQFMPELIKVIPATSDTKRTMVLSDATALVLPTTSRQGMASVMDIKLGTRSFRTDCPNLPKEKYFEKYAMFEQTLSAGKTEETWSKLLHGNQKGPRCLITGKLGKKDYLSFRDGTTTSSEFGFRLTALSDKEYSVTQAKSRSIQTVSQFRECLERFLSDGQDGFNTARGEAYVKVLAQVEVAFQESKMAKKYDLVGTSLLLVHYKEMVAVRWIDFANSTPATIREDRAGLDVGNGIIHGIATLRNLIMDLNAKHSEVPENLYF